MAAGAYDFPDHIKGDTFDGVGFTITVNGVALNLTGVGIRMQLRKGEKGSVVKEFTNAVGGGITVTNALAGKFEIDSQIIDISAATYNHDIQFTLLSGEVRTYIAGTWTIIQDITHDG